MVDLQHVWLLLSSLAPEPAYLDIQGQIVWAKQLPRATVGVDDMFDSKE
jgi:hypothetical protein